MSRDFEQHAADVLVNTMVELEETRAERDKLAAQVAHRTVENDLAKQLLASPEYTALYLQARAETQAEVLEAERDALVARMAQVEAVLDSPALIERLAEYAHNAWAGWTTWMFDKWDATHLSGEPFQTRWRRQIATPYAELNESEKQSDRVEATEILAIITAALVETER